jgi:hypothetical protein
MNLVYCYGFPFFSAVSHNHDSTFASKRIAISFLGSSPTVGRRTRRVCASCLSDSSWIAAKSILFDFIFLSFFPAGSARADDPRDSFLHLIGVHFFNGSS